MCHDCLSEAIGYCSKVLACKLRNLQLRLASPVHGIRDHERRGKVHYMFFKHARLLGCSFQIQLLPSRMPTNKMPSC